MESMSRHAGDSFESAAAALDAVARAGAAPCEAPVPVLGPMVAVAVFTGAYLAATRLLDGWLQAGAMVGVFAGYLGLLAWVRRHRTISPATTFPRGKRLVPAIAMGAAMGLVFSAAGWLVGRWGAAGALALCVATAGVAGVGLTMVNRATRREAALAR